ncbi:aminopeptidase [Brevibacillus sp. B_LB10_24]|uniref:aminopeptidase n=1 Tax=Brevibacillus sp. B_LB10_24 TaxID=3380645 RepID=UPI0038BD9924
MNPLLIEASRNILKTSIGLAPGETLLVVSDRQKQDIAEAICQAGLGLGAEAMLVVMKERQKDGEEPPGAVAAAMEQADVVICVTEYSLTHTNARKNAAAKGARIATMPGITADMFTEGAITADYGQVKARTEKVSQYLTNGREVRIEKDGRTLRFSIADRAGIASTGVYLNPGESGNLPSGEAYLAPVEGTAFGEIVVDGSIAGIGKVSEPLIVTVEKGRIVGAQGAEAAQLLELLGEGDGLALGEFGIGTNDKARVTGNVLEDEKVYGTIHVAFGSNRTFGGSIDAGVHIDLVVHQPDVYIDGISILQKGRLTV